MTDPRAALREQARLVREQAQVAPAGRSGQVPSPCEDVCRMDEASSLCEGCLRTIDEITRWSRLDDDGKRAVWRLIEQRAMEPSP